MLTKVTRQMLAEEGVPAVQNLSRVTGIVKNNVTYPILPVVPVIDVLEDGIPENAPMGSLVIFKEFHQDSNSSAKGAPANGYNSYALAIRVSDGKGEASGEYGYKRNLLSFWDESEGK